MNEMTTILKSPAPRSRKRLTGKEAVAETREALATITSTIAPSVPELIPLGRLRRAPENIRRIRMAEDVDVMADDIAGHGLLQSLIGYAGQWPDDAHLVYIVGGGRRLQGLNRLQERELLDDTFTVPVLIRDQSDAIELSLAENLQQRTMSAVDEVFGFKALMDRGTNSPEGLAKRFGFSERVVKQRLRLASLHPDILDALGSRSITIDSAMAYAKSQDQEIQGKVFKAQCKSTSHGQHSASNIGWAYRDKTVTTASPLFKYVGETAYERDGSGYEDDLFTETQAEGDIRTLTNAPRLRVLAEQHIAFQMVQRQQEMAEALQCETVDGFVKLDDIVFPSWGMTPPKAPAGFAWVGNVYNQSATDRMWKTVRNNRIKVRLLVGINGEGELEAYDRGFYVEKGQLNAVMPPQDNVASAEKLTPEQQAAAVRANEIERIAYREAVGTFEGTPFEGRARIATHGWISPAEPDHMRRNEGLLIAVQVWVSKEQAEAATAHATAIYDQILAERAAEIAAREAQKATAADAIATRTAELVDMAPPGIALIDGDIWERAEDGSYSVTDEGADGYVPNWIALLANFDANLIEQVFATRDEFEVSRSVEGARDDALVAQALAMDPEPEVMILDGEPWARGESGTFTLIGADDDGVDTVETLAALIALYSECVDAIFPTRAEYDAKIATYPAEEIDQ
ncbi:hypothetical protein EQZ23_10800 [Sphingomonas sp. UV9]|uniref:ParB/RepB/Spo0J family partition protein n=1 Tax=Sphingomonas sp. UV9 TaxID=1851410 RepID=UPI000FFC55F4|nr:ParB/RepB/Spo0J family partition protein [Sphingomonas sp. UV9]RXD05539.1 hypothetical protein EQZ23_10800 [Sphingomonas sp. UV9]